MTEADGSLERDSHVEITRTIGEAVLSALPEDFVHAELTCHMLAGKGASQCWYAMPNGSRLDLRLPIEINRLARDLRQATYAPGKGAWYTAKFTFWADGNLEVDYDYDSMPDFEGVTSRDLLEDLSEFPREPQLVPSWMPKPGWTPRGHKG